MLHKKVILLDMDGVMVRHPTLSTHISKGCVQYVSNKLAIDRTSAQKLNKLLYQRFGHTLLGLDRIYDYDLTKTVPEFSKMVYNHTLLETIRTNMMEDPMFHQMTIELKQLLLESQNKDISVHIFTNAPRSWCQTMMDLLKVNMDDFAEHPIFCSGDDIMGTNLKPQPILYKNLLDYLQYVYKDPMLEILFVDDSLQNLMPIMDHPNWTPIYMNGELAIGTNHMTTVKSLTDLAELI
jgi:FMN phosphatase YigB (HAD superfamily)